MSKKGSPYSTKLESLHRHRLTKILGMQTNGYEGIDLSDDVYAIELKCKLLGSRHQTAISVANYQFSKFKDAYQDRELLWAFLYYRLSDSINEIVKNTNGHNFSEFITERNVYFKP